MGPDFIELHNGDYGIKLWDKKDNGKERGREGGMRSTLAIIETF